MSKNLGKNTTSINDGPNAEGAPSSGALGTHLAQMSWRVAVAFLFFAVGGIYLDRAFDSSPVFSMTGVLIALLAVIAVVYQYVNKQFPETFKGDSK